MITNPVKTPPAKFDTLHNGSGLWYGLGCHQPRSLARWAEYSREESPLYYYDRCDFILNTLNNDIHLSPSI